MEFVRLSVASSTASVKSSSIGQRWVISLVFTLAALFSFVFPEGPLKFLPARFSSLSGGDS